MEEIGDHKNTESCPKCSINFKYNAETKSRADVLYNSLRVDSEPGSVIRQLSVEDNILSINLSSSSITNLRASINGLLENIKTISDIIEKFEISSEYSYSYL